MQLYGSILIDDLSLVQKCRTRPLRSCIMTTNIQGTYFIRIQNSMHPSGINYRISDLVFVYNKFMKDGKLTLRFKEPKHQILFNADDKSLLPHFLEQINNICRGRHVRISSTKLPKKIPRKKETINRFGPDTTEFQTIEQFDYRILNMHHLTSLSLKNCPLPVLPAELGNLPIQYLNLSGCSLPSLINQQALLWNWMSGNTINLTLTHLEMNSLDLELIPFEMMYLKNLKTLCMNKNRLKFLPQWIVDFPNIQSLYFADNQLRVIPGNLVYKRLEFFDVSSNKLLANEFFSIKKFKLVNGVIIDGNLKANNGKPENQFNPISLRHLSFYSIVDNCIKFKRQEIPSTLWKDFNLFGPCSTCFRKKLCGYINSLTCTAPSASTFKTDCGIVPYAFVICEECHENMPL